MSLSKSIISKIYKPINFSKAISIKTHKINKCENTPSPLSFMKNPSCLNLYLFLASTNFLCKTLSALKSFLNPWQISCVNILFQTPNGYSFLFQVHSPSRANHPCTNRSVLYKDGLIIFTDGKEDWSYD